MINNLYQVMVKTFRHKKIRKLLNKNKMNLKKKMMMSSPNKSKIKFKMFINR